VAAVLLLAGCGAHGQTSGSDHAGPSHTTTDPTSHTPGPWPTYPADDYTYTLRVSCFCADAGVPVVVTVRGGRAVNAVYARTRYGHTAGATAGQWLRISLNDVIDAANAQDAYRVEVMWPEGQDYPRSVWVDHSAHTADDEIGYSVRHVNRT
jgi:hypothetical protein